MQSMNIPFLSSLGARRTKHGLGRRATWLMVTLAALFAVLAVAVPMQRTVWAADPTIEVEVVQDTINYETVDVTITLSNIDGLVDADDNPDWILSVRYKAASETYGHSMTGGPGLDWESDFSHQLDGQGRLTLTLNKMIPASIYEVKATLQEEYNNTGQWMKKAEDSVTFTTKSGCTPAPNPGGFYAGINHEARVVWTLLRQQSHRDRISDSG